jgi:hypothetical protein
MVSCYPTSYENGTDTRLYVDANLSGVPSWLKVGGETTSKISIKPVSAEATNKDAAAGMSMPVGYDWSMTGECQWDLDDPGQMLLRAMPLALELRRIAWKPKGSTTGYYGYALVGWDADATQRAITKMTLTINGCGEIVYA